MTPARHIFHTRHDFTPTLGMEIMRLIWLAENAVQDITSKDILDVADLVGLPLHQRRNVDKILASLCDVGLLAKRGQLYRTTEWAKVLRQGTGQWASGFFAAVHALYAWGWDESYVVATPCWSYQEACRVIRDSGVLGVSTDEIVLKIVDRARARFGISRVSFSRSSVAGILGWLEVQSPPLIERHKGRIYSAQWSIRSADTIDAILAAAANRMGNPLRLAADLLDRIAASLLLPRDIAFELMQQRTTQGHSLIWIDGTPPAILMSGPADPFLSALTASDQSRTSSVNS